jgi:hypothetical protein
MKAQERLVRARGAVTVAVGGGAAAAVPTEAARAQTAL